MKSTRVTYKAKVDFVLFHLNNHIELPESLQDRFVFANGSEVEEGMIYFNVNDSTELDINKIIRIDNIPILFPHSDSEKPFTVKGKSVIFYHDFISSAFYLLSGQQETEDYKADSYGRFPYTESLQHKLGITHIPVVNYYFEWIIQGIEEFGKLNGIEVKRKMPNAPFTFALSHDIDRIDRYDHFHIIYHLKELLGIEKTGKSKAKALKDLIVCSIEWAKGKNRKNPWWNFKEMTDIENELGIKSSFYFLPNHNYKVDSFYNLEEPRVIDIMNKLINEGFEVGIHAPVASANSSEIMQNQVSRLNKLISKPAAGNRQHNLCFKYPDTLQHLQEAGIKYDTTLGFAEHEGFRNSYCHPFRPFDHEKNETMDIWEIPLTVMDATLFKYQKYSYEQANEAIDNLLNEIEKFGGVFSLLWHNSYYDNEVIPDLKNFYEKLLVKITRKKPVAIAGRNIIQ